ncbi:MAG TPA: hypothetical protein DCZ95_09595 [Verrucomicrobia bacterium]|nr:MAG: hypothetical protein A2X46_10495 [Lentisphaerae bacterium GWF2_57_35]HBA84333.1 hypothetical protein [Verrucomicrobiota bacterium]
MFKPDKKVWIALLVIVAAAIWFRVAGQDSMALRADSLEFWRICGQQITGSQIFEHWLEIMGLSGQFPFPMASTKWFVDASGLPLTLLSLRLPSILWGVLSVLFAYGVGRRFAGPGAGLFLAAMLALNAFHIQMTREAYYYPPMAAGAFLGLWGAAWAVQRWRRPEAESALKKAGYALVNLAGFGLLIYSQPTGLFPAILYAAVVALSEIMILVRSRRLAWVPVGLAAGYLMLGFPLLLAPWGLSQLRQISSGELKQAALKALSVSQESMGTLVVKGATMFAWGGTPLRILFMAVFGGAGLWWIAARLRKNWEHALIPYMLIGVFLSFLYARSQAGALFEPRYLIGLLPAYLLLLALGGVALMGWFKRVLPDRQPFRSAALLAPAACLALSVYPAWLCTRMTGQPTPYLQIQEWMNTHLPSQTPVLVDRWFEPWNELAVHPSTNVIFTFTVPNEPVDTFVKARWRDTAIEFLEKYPDAAYMQVAKTYWDVPAVGPWAWPEEYFARHVSLRNEAGIGLRKLGLGARNDYYAANTNRLVVDVYYNELSDVVARARRKGSPFVVWYGPGWSYTKLWRQIQGDFRDWRVLPGRAVLNIVNCTENEIQAAVTLKGVALNGAKRVYVDPTQYHEFQANRMMSVELNPMVLKPGDNPLTLSDALWERTQIPLLIESIEVKRRPAGS